MLHAGLDLSRRKLDVCLLTTRASTSISSSSPPDVECAEDLARRIDEVHGGAGLRRDRVDDRRPARPRHARAAGLVRSRSPTPRRSRASPRLPARPTASTRWCSRSSPTAISCRRSGCPIPRVREERELARFRLHLVKHKSMLKNRIHSTLINFGRPCPVTDLFGVEGRRLLARLDVPEPWRGNVTASVELIDDLERPDRSDQPPAQGRPRRPPLHPAADERAGDRLGARVHDRRRDRRDRALLIAPEAHRLHRPLPARQPVGRQRPPRAA